MRVLIVTVALLCVLGAGAVAQQSSSNDAPTEKKAKNAETAAKNQDKKPSQLAE